MTLQEYRTLDGEVAEFVFGWTEETVPPDGAGEHGGGKFLVFPGFKKFWDEHPGFLPPKGPIARYFLCRPWSQSRDDVQEVLKAMYEKVPESFIENLAVETVKAGDSDISCGCNKCKFVMMMAKPEQICRAAVATMKQVGKPKD